MAVATRETIIADLYRDPTLDRALRTMKPDHLREDLRQEIFLVLCAMPDDQLQEMHARTGTPLRYLLGTMVQMVKTNNHKFFRQYRRQPPAAAAGVQTASPSPTRRESTDAAALVWREIEGLHWYHATLLKIYAEKKCSYTDVSRETGVPRKVVAASLRTSIATIKTNLKTKYGIDSLSDVLPVVD